MQKTKIAIIREGKNPPDTRTPITPKQAAFINAEFPSLEIICQESPERCFSNEEYKNAGIKVLNDISDCAILMGVKEVPPDQLIRDKTYFMFSHTIKKQPYNRSLLQNILQKNIRLVDYECLKDIKGNRIIAFGRWAGIVGAYNALWTYGKKYNLFDIKRAYQCHNREALIKELESVRLPSIKILVTGNGRVARGSLEVMSALGIQQVEPAPFFYQTFQQPVYTQLDVDTYYRHKRNHPFDFRHFFNHPAEYESAFSPFTKVTDILINAVYWNSAAPRLFEINDMRHSDFRIQVIADITCDINGSIPVTVRSTTIEDPVFDFDVSAGIETPFHRGQNISVMAIDNLPNELPRDASEDFGNQLIRNIIPSLAENAKDDIIDRATITENGHLTSTYSYLDEYVKG